MKAVYIKRCACLNCLLEKKISRKIYAHPFVTLSRFYYVRDAKSTHSNNTGRVINNYVLIMRRRYKAVLSEVKMPSLCCCIVLVGMLRLGLAGLLSLLARGQCWPPAALATWRWWHEDSQTRSLLWQSQLSDASQGQLSSDQVETHCVKASLLEKPFPFRLKIISDRECEFPPKFDWLQHAASSEAYSAFGTLNSSL